MSCPMLSKLKLCYCKSAGCFSMMECDPNTGEMVVDHFVSLATFKIYKRVDR